MPLLRDWNPNDATFSCICKILRKRGKIIILWHISLFRFLGKFSQNEEKNKKKLLFLGHLSYSDFDFMAIFIEQFLVFYSLENFRLDMLPFTVKSVLGCSLLMQCQNYFIIKKNLQPGPKNIGCNQ
jgi:hypothetical protein